MHVLDPSTNQWIPATAAALSSGDTGGSTGGTTTTPLRVLGSQELTVGGTAVALTIPAGASYAEIQIQGGDIRARYDGTAPTATTGFLWTDGGTATVSTAAELGALKLIAVSGTVKAFITYKGV